LTAAAINSTQIDLDWTGSTDNNGVVGYNVYRNGSLIAILGNVGIHSDTTVSPSTHYTYEIKARDEAGNRSDASNSAPVTTP
jgi:chitodextrinase